MREILGACAAADEAAQPAVLATVVRTEGSTYRKVGARMLFPRQGAPVGFVSGGCLEADLAERAAAVLESGESRTVVYDMRSPDDIVWGLGLGCNGEVRVLLERLEPGSPPPWLGFLRVCHERRVHGVLATVFDVAGDAPAEVGQRLMLGPDDTALASVSGPGLRRAIEADARALLAAGRSGVRHYSVGPAGVGVCFERIVPPPVLVVFGAGADAVPVVRMAAEMGWDVEVADHRPASASLARFPGAARVARIDFDDLAATAPVADAATAVLVMTHHFLHDLDLLTFLLESSAAYLGFLGPRQRLLNLLEEHGKRHGPVIDEQRRRLYGPAGLDIGAETPEEIALSALSEIRAVLSGCDGGSLRDRSGPLHR